MGSFCQDQFARACDSQLVGFPIKADLSQCAATRQCIDVVNRRRGRAWLQRKVCHGVHVILSGNVKVIVACWPVRWLWKPYTN